MIVKFPTWKSEKCTKRAMKRSSLTCNTVVLSDVVFALANKFRFVNRERKSGKDVEL